MRFEELRLHPDLLRGVAEMGFTELTPVQEKTLPKSLDGKDVAVQSQTGTGKTAAFLLTIFQRQLQSPGEPKKALIIAPTRELAVQIEAEARLIGRYPGLRIGCFYGGVGYNRQENLLKQGVEVMVGTPGRLIDLGQKGLLKTAGIGFLVIDEADRLFDMGFLPDIRRILRRLPQARERQTMLFSATLSGPAMQIAREFMNDPEKIFINPEQLTVDKIDQELYHVGQREKFSLLLGLLKQENPASALFFTNMKHDAERLSLKLNQNGYRTEFLTGDLSQSRRLAIIDDFKHGRLQYLIATDVAARGLHVEGLDLVVNFDLPGDPENYVHRIGRTARAGKSGKAVTLVCEKYLDSLEAIEGLIDMKIPVKFAEEQLFLADRSPSRFPGKRDRGGRPGRRTGGPPRDRRGQGRRPGSFSKSGPGR